MSETSEHYFKESDRIANKDKYPPGDLEAIDRFLARRNVGEFSLNAILDKTSVRKNAKPLLHEYVKLRVLKITNRYYCPEHQNKPKELEVSHRLAKSGVCTKCDKTYSLNTLEPEIFYKRIRNPRLWSDSLSTNLNSQPKQPWYRDRKFVITSVIALIAVLVNIIQGLTCNTEIKVVLPPTEVHISHALDHDSISEDDAVTSMPPTDEGLNATEKPVSSHTDAVTRTEIPRSPTMPS